MLGKVFGGIVSEFRGAVADTAGRHGDGIITHVKGKPDGTGSVLPGIGHELGRHELGISHFTPIGQCCSRVPPSFGGRARIVG